MATLLRTPQLARAFPNLTDQNHTVESPATPEYNCIAWAAGENDVRVWPLSPDHEWPDGVENTVRIEAFIDLYASIGYEVSDSGALEPGLEKVAIYAIGDAPQHAALQLATGQWTSKLGDLHDILHDDPTVVAGGAYGAVVVYMKREREP